MNKEEIARMYEQVNGWSPAPYAITMEELERFAALVASAEREACAKVCEDSVEYAGDTLAEAIRARGSHD